MNIYLAVTGTVTYAIKGRDALKRLGYKAELKKTVNAQMGAGCGYGVVTNCSPAEIESIFSKFGIRLLKILDYEA